MKDRELLWALLVWVLVFAVIFAIFYLVIQRLDKPGVDDPVDVGWLFLLGQFVIPQVVSAVVGARVYARRRRQKTGAQRNSALFAAAASMLGAFGSVLWYLLIIEDRPSGWKFVSWLAIIFAMVAATDCTAATVFNWLIGRESERRRREAA
jgi:drug/metabolite transporter (DMT)-like permease